MTNLPGYRVEKLVARAGLVPALLPVFDYLRTMPGMSLCADLPAQVAYVNSENLDLYICHNMDWIGDVPHRGYGIAGIAGIKYHRAYRYEPFPYKVHGATERTIFDAAELCCLVVMPEFRGLGLSRELTVHRLREIGGRTAFLELRPSERSANALMFPPEPHESTAVVQTIAKDFGFVYSGRARADNSMVLVKS